jgi:hypothetical protein
VIESRRAVFINLKKSRFEMKSRDFLASSLLVFSVVAANPLFAQRTLFLPEDGLTHDVGALSGSGRLEWITTIAGNNNAGVLGRTELTMLEAGDYRAIAQVFHKQYAGKPLGSISVKDSAGTVLQQNAVTSDVFPKYENGGYQRVTLDFTVPSPVQARQIEFYDQNNHYLWLGAISILKKQRPFYIMGHHANTKDKADNYVNDGANHIECDIHPVLNSDSDGKDYSFYAVHFANDEFTRQYTNSDGIEFYFQNIKAHMDAGRIQLITLDCKETLIREAPTLLANVADMKKYGKSLANLMTKCGIPPERVLMCVPEAYVDDLIAGATEANFKCGVDAYCSLDGGNRNFDEIKGWCDRLEAKKTTFADIGKDEAVRGEFFRYAYWLNEVIKRRDTGSQIKNVYFWTVNNEQDMRNMLDYGVDGILTDYPATLKSLLNEQQYAGVYRIADKGDSQFSRYRAPSPPNVPAPVAPSPPSVPAPQVAVDPVFKNSRFILATHDGNYYAKWYSGKSYYYPQIKSGQQNAETIQFGADGSQLSYGNEITIFLPDSSGFNDSWRSYNKLGTFNSGVYYYQPNGDDDKYTWIIESADAKNGPVVGFGHRIRLKNKSYGQYLYPKSANPSTQTQADSTTVWTIGKP